MSDEAPLELTCNECKKPITSEDLDNGTASRLVDPRSFGTGEIKYSETEAAHVSCLIDAGALPPDGGPATMQQPQARKREAWEREWHDVLNYAYAVRSRIRAASEQAEAAVDLETSSAVVMPPELLPSPQRPLHIGHPVVEAWFTLFDHDVVDRISHLLQPQPMPSDDALIFGSALAFPDPDAWMNLEEPSATGAPTPKEHAEECERLLVVVQGSIVALKQYCAKFRRAPKPYLVRVVEELRNQVSTLGINTPDEQAKERSFGPTF